MKLEGQQITSGGQSIFSTRVWRVEKPLSVAEIKELHTWSPEVQRNVLPLLEQNDALAGNFAPEACIDHLVRRPKTLNGNVLAVTDMLAHSHVGITMLMANETRDSATGIINPLLYTRFLRDEFDFFRPFISKEKLEWFASVFDRLEDGSEASQESRPQAIQLIEELLRQLSLFDIFPHWIFQLRSKLKGFLSEIKCEDAESQISWDAPNSWVILAPDAVHYRVVENMRQLRASNPLRVRIFE